MKKLIVLIVLIFVAMYAKAQTNCYVPSMNGPVKLSNSMLYCNVQDSVDVTKILGFGNSGYSRVLTLGSGLTVTDSVISASGGSDWSLTGNAGTNPAINFIGTTDSVNFVIKSKNIPLGRYLPNGVVQVGDYTNNYAGNTYIQLTSSGSDITLNALNNAVSVSGTSIQSNLSDGISVSSSIIQNAIGDILLDGTGNVGIGTSSPAAKLDITGSFNQSVTGTSTGYTITNSMYSKVPEGVLLQTMGSGTGNFTGNLTIAPDNSQLKHSTDTSNSVVTLSDTAITFTTFGGDAMFVRNNGNVGIGVSAPTYKLDQLGSFRSFNVNGPVKGYIYNESALYGGPALYVTDTTDGSNTYFTVSNSSFEAKSTNGTDIVAITGSPTIGSPSFGVAINNNTIINVESGGVGIGTNTTVPTSKLTVTGGNIEVTDTGNGIILKSPDGTPWLLTISDLGVPVVTVVP